MIETKANVTKKSVRNSNSFGHFFENSPLLKIKARSFIELQLQFLELCGSLRLRSTVSIVYNQIRKLMRDVKSPFHFVCAYFALYTYSIDFPITL
jgi:hypothetical protein